MSTEEQQAIIGRLVMERSEANRKRALLQYQIGRFPDKLSLLAGHLSRADASDSVAQALGVLSDLIAAGSLDRLKEIVSEYQSITARVNDLYETLRKAGLD